MVAVASAAAMVGVMEEAWVVVTVVVMVKAAWEGAMVVVAMVVAMGSVGWDLAVMVVAEMVEDWEAVVMEEVMVVEGMEVEMAERVVQMGAVNSEAETAEVATEVEERVVATDLAVVVAVAFLGAGKEVTVVMGGGAKVV